MYLACYGFAYYKADPEHITMEVFDGMIDGVCKIAQQENLMFLMPYMCVMDYPTINTKAEN